MTPQAKQRLIRKYASSLGMCIKCYLRETINNTQMCTKCATRHNKYQSKYRNMPDHCSRCGGSKPLSEYKTCKKCRLHK